MKLLSILFAFVIFLNSYAQEEYQVIGPREYVFDSTDANSLKAYIFTPPEKILNRVIPAIVIFHGGGWSMGEPSWAFGLAEKYAKRGMVAISAQYRLSDQKNITPIDAIEDARNLIIWIRKNSKELKINPNCIVAYGWSAGAHLAACTAVFPSFDYDSISSIPNALVLYSPALSLEADEWFKKLLMNKGDPLDFSPAEHVKGNMPPSIIVVGKDDSVTPVGQSILFHHKMTENNNESYLFIFDGVGHLFTPAGQPDDGYPNPDKTIQTKAYTEIDLFLKQIECMQ